MVYTCTDVTTGLCTRLVDERYRRTAASVGAWLRLLQLDRRDAPLYSDLSALALNVGALARVVVDAQRKRAGPIGVAPAGLARQPASAGRAHSSAEQLAGLAVRRHGREVVALLCVCGAAGRGAEIERS